MSELIVVGVDGSAEATAALTYAVTDAARRGARVRVVTVSQMPEYWAVPSGTPSVSTQQPVDFVSVAQQVAQEAVAAFAADHPALAGQVEMEIVGVTGHAASELVEQSREAERLGARAPRTRRVRQHLPGVGRAQLRAARALPGHHRPTQPGHRSRRRDGGKRAVRRPMTAH